MKISYSNTPILRRLESGKLGEIGFDMHTENSSDVLLLAPQLKSAFNLWAPLFKRDIYNFSKPFMQAAHQAYPQMIREEIYNDIGVNSGTILDLGGAFKSVSACFFLRPGTNPGVHEYVIMLFKKSNFNFVAYLCQDSEYFYGTASRELTEAFHKNNPDKTERDLYFLIHNFIVMYVNFIKYAEIQTKILPAKTKEKGINCKYINDTNSLVKNIDSTWFTNLVKSDAFKVSGHFRLQPYKDENGMPKKKLIWINDFMKSGYTSPARKLKNTF